MLGCTLRANSKISVALVEFVKDSCAGVPAVERNLTWIPFILQQRAEEAEVARKREAIRDAGAGRKDVFAATTRETWQWQPSVYSGTRWRSLFSILREFLASLFPYEKRDSWHSHDRTNGRSCNDDVY